MEFKENEVDSKSEREGERDTGQHITTNGTLTNTRGKNTTVLCVCVRVCVCVYSIAVVVVVVVAALVVVVLVVVVIQTKNPKTKRTSTPSLRRFVALFVLHPSWFWSAALDVTVFRSSFLRPKVPSVSISVAARANPAGQEQMAVWRTNEREHHRQAVLPCQCVVQCPVVTRSCLLR